MNTQSKSPNIRSPRHKDSVYLLMKASNELAIAEARDISGNDIEARQAVDVALKQLKSWISFKYKMKLKARKSTSKPWIKRTIPGLDIPSGAATALYRAGITTIDQLCSLTSKQFRKIKGLNFLYGTSISNELYHMGREFAPEVKIKVPKEIAGKPIESLGLPESLVRRLKSHPAKSVFPIFDKMETIGDLLECTESQILRVKTVGRKSLALIRAALCKLNISNENWN